jgi:lysyl-tRNA synthetase class I
MKEKRELAMYFVTRSRTISFHLPLDIIDDTVFKLACFQHKKHSTSPAYTYIDLFHVLLGTEGGPAVQSTAVSIFVGSFISAIRLFLN